MATLVPMPVSKGRKKANKRPTPPKKPAVSQVEEKGASPTWYVVPVAVKKRKKKEKNLINYMGVLPGGTSNLYLLGGLAMIGVGFAMTLNYR